MNKKYFSIAEVAKMTGLSVNKLRYIEKSDPAIIVQQVRNRRYYTEKIIEVIKQKYSNSTAIGETNQNIINQIDQLIAKFSGLINT